LQTPPKLYSDFAKYYDRLESQYRDYSKEARWIQNLLKSSRSQQVVDISCGTGRHLQEIVTKGWKGGSVLGIDASLEMVSLAKTRLRSIDNADVMSGDFLGMPIRSESTNAAICMYWSIAGLNHSQVEELFNEVNRILLPGGLFIFDVENAEGIKENLLNSPFIDAFFFDPETNSNVIRINYSKKVEPALVDWHSYYLFETGDVSQLFTDEMKLRFYSKKTLESWLIGAGFKVLEVSSSPDGKYERRSPTLYFVARKK
jgi:ubiquinone/menaquinone biosynthesis C-methylase UbiE